MLVFQPTPGSLLPPYPYTAAVAAHLLLQVIKQKIQLKNVRSRLKIFLLQHMGLQLGSQASYLLVQP